MKTYELNAKGDTATLYVYDIIGEDFFSDDALTAKRFADDLAAIGKVKEINVRINSPGGSIFDARAMASLLKAHPANIVVDIDGICASAATYIALAGDERRMAFDGTFMVHKPAGMMFGTADDMRKEAEVLDKLEEAIVATYVDATGRDVKEISKLVQNETWMSGEEALNLGFVHELTGQKAMQPSVNLAGMPYQNVPERLINKGLRSPIKAVVENGRVRVVFTHGETRLEKARNAVNSMRMKLEHQEMTK